MSKRANPTLIGGFVLGAIALAVVTILVLSSGSLFAQHRQYLLIFDGSVKGLEVGAPVTFRGVQVGMVKDISVLVDPDSGTISIPVTIEMEPERFTLAQGTLQEVREKMSIPHLIDQGLRAQLQLQSLLTGQLYIALDFYPDKPARYAARDKRIPEIPTIPTTVQELAKKFENFPIDDILKDLTRTADSLDRVLSSPDIPRTITNLNQSLVSLDKMLMTMQNTIGEDSPIANQLSDTLQEVTKTARSVRTLADTLDRQPEALLKGKRSDNK